MTRWTPPRATVRLRNATVASTGAGTVTLSIDGTTVASVPVHGPMPATGAVVLVLEQGTSLLVMGDAVSRIAALEERVAALEGRSV